MKRTTQLFLTVLFVAALSYFALNRLQNNDASSVEKEDEDEMYDSPDKAAEFQFKRTKDPFTGQIPSGKMWQGVMETQSIKDQFSNSSNLLSALTWEERGSYTDAVGPSNGNTRANNGITSGRIDAIWVDKTDPTGKTVWIGGDMGGLWKTNDITAFPATWTLINDFFVNLVISSITQDPTNLNTMYFSTGEAYYGGELGAGVFKSVDHGITWTQLPSTTSYTRSSKILCDFQGNVYLASNGIVSGAGLLRSTNGGTTWTDITPTGLSNRICDLEITSTTSPARLHVVTGISSAMGYRFTDNPSTVTSGSWTTPTVNFTTSALKRAEIAVNGNTLFALPVDNSNQVPTVYKSTDGGDNWAPTTGQPASGWATGQGWYALAAAINPSNSDECIIGGLDNWKTSNGGASWTKISAWVGTSGQYVHADQHTSLWYDNGNKFLFGSDGGVFYSTDGGATSQDRNVGLRLKEFYSCAIHPTSTHYFLAGSQDNGTHQLNGPGLTSSIEVTGGDGAYVDIDQDQPQYQFGAYIYNQYRRSTNGGATWGSVNFSSSAGEFINPFDYDDLNNRMYCSHNAGQYLRWDDPQTGNSSSLIPIASFNGSGVSAVTVSPFTPNRVYFGTGGGRIVQVDNAETATPTDVNISGTGMAGYANAVIVGSDDQHLMACFSNYGVTNVWVTVNGGTTWTACDGNLPNIPVYWGSFHPDDNTKAYIATETGVWETDLLNGTGTIWVPSPSFPTVRTTMLKYRSMDRTLLASTYGRGLWTATVPVISAVGFEFSITPATTSVTCGIASASILLNTISNGGYVTPINLSATGNPPGTTVSFSVNPLIPGNSTNVILNNVNILTPGTYNITVTGVSGTLTQVKTLTYTITPGAGPSITTQPNSQISCAGSSVTFSIAATAALSYQWQLSTDGGTTYNNIAGANGTIYTIASTLVSQNNYRYSCIVNGQCNNSSSSAALLTVNTSPSISTQPVSTAVCAGNAVSFSVAANGSSIGYQWQLSIDGGVTFNNLTGATTTTYSFTSALSQNGYQYRCIINGSCSPAATSAAATLTVGSTLVINSQPDNNVLCAGGTTSFSVGVTGTVTYQWQESTNGGTTYSNLSNGGIYSGTTTNTLTLNGVPASANNNLYRCVISGNCPSINSLAGALTINTAPAITAQPVSTSTICAAQNTTFSVNATGTALAYQWQESIDGGITFTNLSNGGVYSNVTSATLSLTGATVLMNSYKYRCIISGTCAPAVTTSISTLVVFTPVNINTNPTGVTVCENSNGSFSVTAAGTTPTYQWQVSTNGGTSFTNILNGGVYTGATTSTLSLSGVNFGLTNNQYRCIVSGAAPCGIVNSGAAVLTVNPAPAQFAVSGGGAFCTGGAGVAVGLNNSVTGINYQLLLNGVNSGSPVPGTGSAITFGNKTVAGNYTVIAYNAVTGCTQQMTSGVNVVVNPLPTIMLNASPYKNLYPGLTTTLTASATSSANPITYQWLKNNTPVSNSGNTLAVNITGMGDYRVIVTDANGCINQSQVVTIADSANNKLFIYPSPNNGQFSVVYYNPSGTSNKRIVTIISSKGEKVYYKESVVTQAYQVLDIDLRRNGGGVYYVILSDANGKTIKSGEVLVR